MKYSVIRDEIWPHLDIEEAEDGIEIPEEFVKDYWNACTKYFETKQKIADLIYDR
jgi:hypothetical protein